MALAGWEEEAAAAAAAEAEAEEEAEVEMAVEDADGTRPSWRAAQSAQSSRSAAWRTRRLDASRLSAQPMSTKRLPPAP